VGAESDGTITWRSLLAEATTALGERTEARWICEEAGGWEGSEWLAVLDEPAGERAVARFDRMLARRIAGEPLQYVLGHWAFRHLDLLIDRRVLIPRPETEQVAGVAIDIARRRGSPVTVVDLGTGSGAIALALASELPLDGTSVWATDASSDALDVARANLAGIGRAAANVRLLHGDWFAALVDHPELRGHVDVIVSNPPYVKDADPEVDAAVVDWEPAGALFAGSDGLDAVRVIVAGAGDWLAPGGSLVVEIGCDQGPTAAALARDAGFERVDIVADAAGHDRVLVARTPA